jgi:quercetin dioxygenase-like cupin family protein
MDIRSAKTITPVIMHEAVTVWSLFPKFSLHDQTRGTYLEAVEEWTITPNTRAEPHFHDTHEFFFFLEGDAVEQIEQEARQVGPGDLVYIPRNAVHAVRSGPKGVRAFSFSVSYQRPEGTGYAPAELAEVSVIE